MKIVAYEEIDTWVAEAWGYVNFSAFQKVEIVEKKNLEMKFDDKNCETSAYENHDLNYKLFYIYLEL